MMLSNRGSYLYMATLSITPEIFTESSRAENMILPVYHQRNQVVEMQDTRQCCGLYRGWLRWTEREQALFLVRTLIMIKQ